MWLSSGTARLGIAGQGSALVWQEGCTPLAARLEVWEVEEMVVVAGWPLALSSPLVPALPA